MNLILLLLGAITYLTSDGSALRVTLSGDAATDTVYVIPTASLPVTISDANDTLNITFADTLPVKYIDGKARVSSMPYLYDIAEGNVAGHSSWSKLGYNGDVDVETEDLWTVGGQYVFPASERPMEILSSSTNDSVTGTGARTVRVWYLDDAFVEKTCDVNLSGTTVVQLDSTNIYRVNAMRVLTAGTGAAAAGTITLRDTSNSPSYNQIAASNTRDRVCVWTVPTGKTLYVTSIAFGVSGTANAKSVVFTTQAKYDNLSMTARDFFVGYNEVALIDNNYFRPLEIPTKLASGTDLKVRAVGITANCVTTCALRGWIE